MKLLKKLKIWGNHFPGHYPLTFEAWFEQQARDFRDLPLEELRDDLNDRHMGTPVFQRIFDELIELKKKVDG
jgi:hypothetical protein